MHAWQPKSFDFAILNCSIAELNYMYTSLFWPWSRFGQLRLKNFKNPIVSAIADKPSIKFTNLCKILNDVTKLRRI